MSDRGPGQIVIYGCPMEEREALLAVLEENDFWLGFGVGNQDGPLKLGEVYGDDDARLDAYDTVAWAVKKAAPNASFAAWSDPKYEYDGSILLYDPGLGMYRGRCNAAGEVYLTATEIRDGLLVGDLRAASGIAWLDRFDQLRVAHSMSGGGRPGES